MNRRTLFFALVAACLVGMASFAASHFERGDVKPAVAPVPSRGLPRVASLSPAVTDTIEALGASASLILVSDYCRARDRPRAGTIISPRFEQLASAKPDLILATRVAGSPNHDLMQVAPLLSLPWLTLDEVADSIRRIGAAVQRQEEADRLATRMKTELADRAESDAPRALLLMGPLREDRVGYFYIRHESLHGRLLTASGYRNAMGEELHPGQPRLSVEELLRVDPDAILVLQETEASPSLPLASLTPLRAVRLKRVSVLSRPGILSMGPDILESRRLVEHALDRLFAEHSP